MQNQEINQIIARVEGLGRSLPKNSSGTTGSQYSGQGRTVS